MSRLPGALSPAAAAARRDAKTRQEIRDALSKAPEGLSGKELGDRCTVRKDRAFTEVRNTMIQEGEVLTEVRPGRGGGTLYRLNPTNLLNLPQPTETPPSEPTEPALYRGQVQDVHPRTCTAPALCSSCGEPLDDVDGTGLHPGCNEVLP